MRRLLLVMLLCLKRVRPLGVLSSSRPARLRTVCSMSSYDVVVIGGGHAGCEAATAAARVGAQTCLVTQRVDTIGEMSCNPSIGGIGKGHLVREIDALGGIMGRAIDVGGVHFRMLNRRKGEAVWGPRAQADRDLYKAAVKELIGEEENLSVLEASVEDVALSQGAVCGVETSAGFIKCKSVVLTTGTFLRGRIYLGLESFAAGRKTRVDDDGNNEENEPPANALARLLEDTLELPLGRLKTGTPPRLSGKTIDWSQCVAQPSEDPPFCFSFLNSKVRQTEMITCFRTHTNAETHKIVMDNKHLLADASTSDKGPRYCPSIYKKVERFTERDSHGVWLEPEGLTTDLVYPNGLSGAYPLEVQEKIINSIVGLEHAKIVQPGYDVEYDFVDPTSLSHELQVIKAPGLYLAGKICGTTGYEEAAALGIVAGTNAGLTAISAKNRFVLSRSDGYTGVLVDDLVTRGTKEPYRMFTSRAEYRLHLRSDNADLRLTPLGAKVGLVSEERLQRYETRNSLVNRHVLALGNLNFPAEDWYAHLPALFDDDNNKERPRHVKTGDKKSAKDILQMPKSDLASVEKAAKILGSQDITVPSTARDTVAANCKYSSYLKRMHRDQAAFSRSGQLLIPPDIDYNDLRALSSEEREKLDLFRPKTLADASNISGVTPASLVYLYNYLSNNRTTRPLSPVLSEQQPAAAAF